mmetsp:Transcript_69604/g.181335  ORF Transcript_69604/g.181335 Transcript_69604/m.181335 type:complete len:200 (-) Transcript_69604:2076-2675(-)
MLALESELLTSRHAGIPWAAGTKVRQVMPPRERCSLCLNFSVLDSDASSVWMLPLLVPAKRCRPVSSNCSARTSVSTFSFWSTVPFCMLTSRRTALELAATNTCGENCRKMATGTGDESVKTFSISPESTAQKRTDLSMEVVTSWSSSRLKKHEVMAREWPTSRECTAMFEWSAGGVLCVELSAWITSGESMAISISVL